MKEAARLLGVSRQHLYTLAERGELRLVRNPAYIKGPVHVPREDVDKILKRGQTSP